MVDEKPAPGDAGRGAALLVSFAHGVDSGDPLTDRIILWTRVSPQYSDENRDENREVKVIWQIASDAAMQHIVNSGVLVTGPDADYTVKVYAEGLQPGQVYYYRFSSGSAHSPIGRSKTLPGAMIIYAKLLYDTLWHGLKFLLQYKIGSLSCRKSAGST